MRYLEQPNSQKQSRTVITKGWRVGKVDSCFMSAKLQFHRIKKSWRSVLQQCEYTTEMYILNGQNGKFCCVLPQLKKKNLKVQQNTEKLGAEFELLKFIHLVDCLILNLFLHSSWDMLAALPSPTRTQEGTSSTPGWPQHLNLKT